MKKLGGLSLWTSYYTDPEILRWYTLLVRHYAVDGNTELLYPKYGFTLEPKLLKNPDWESLDSWKTFGNTALVSVKDAGLPLSPYYPQSVTNMLQLKNANSGASQVVSGLVPGKMYCAYTLFVDPAQDGTQTVYDVEIKVDGVEMEEKTVRQLHDFIKSDKPTFNHIKVVFRAISDKATITLKSGPSAKTALLVDSVHFMPYFEN